MPPSPAALALVHWSPDPETLPHPSCCLQESEAPHLLGGEYQQLDKQLRWLISCLCYGRSAYPHEGGQAAAGDTDGAGDQDSAGADPEADVPRLQLRFLADGAPLTAPGSERKIDTWQERAGERLEDARRLAEHCTALLPSPPPAAALSGDDESPEAMAAVAMLDFDDSDDNDKINADAVEIAQLFRKPEQEQVIEAQSLAGAYRSPPPRPICSHHTYRAVSRPSVELLPSP